MGERLGEGNEGAGQSDDSRTDRRPAVSTPRTPAPSHPRPLAPSPPRILAPSPHSLAWRAAQVVAFLVLLAVIAGLVQWPDATLALLWNGLIPLVPASLALSPALWRNVCPVASLNLISAGVAGRQRLEGSRARAAEWTGVLALALLVPARHVWFNQDAAATLGLVGAAGSAALLFGVRYDLKAGFCNAICPVLPVERLYGQRPLLAVANPRCPSCTVCTPRGCLDLAREKTAAQLMGPARRGHGWLLTPFGAFAAAFPGIILGYFLGRDVPAMTAGAVYLRALVLPAVSWLAVSLVVVGAGVRAAGAVRLLGAVSLSLYYGFAAPGLAQLVGAAWVRWPVMAVAVALSLALVVAERRGAPALAAQPASPPDPAQNGWIRNGRV